MANLFWVTEGVLHTPALSTGALDGTTRACVIALAHELSMPLVEGVYELSHLSDADEIFLTSTSLCICPVSRVNGVPIGPEGQVWGPVTRRIADAYQRFVNHDFIGQYMKCYVDGMEARAF